jgi:hypothetical protein
VSRKTPVYTTPGAKKIRPAVFLQSVHAGVRLLSC